MKINAVRTLWICFSAVVLLLLISGLSEASQTYTVRKGDTLRSIAQKYDVSVVSIQTANKLSNPNHIKTGQKLTIPTNKVKSYRTYAYGAAQVHDLEVRLEGDSSEYLAKGTTFTILEKADGEYKIKLKDGRIGWAKTDLVLLKEGRQLIGESEATGSRIVSMAYNYRGYRYVRGGMSARGFDCSGFVKFLYAKEGIDLPRSSVEQFSCGKPVSKDELQEGDLVFFKNTYKRGISHVGIYIGDGTFIHASTRRTGVRVDRLSDDYYTRKYAGARRIK